MGVTEDRLGGNNQGGVGGLSDWSLQGEVVDDPNSLWDRCVS